ncbi:cation/H+ exchanger 3 [Prunus dulcis]|uniref:Cation/H+ exchanger 3 n=1 Tax=Prunus dulcis TaxID=3755 RepID=A0A4Y1QS37_PRUDU|nr:cation/H+ exchanger 3 [Prunus dulcis]
MKNLSEVLWLNVTEDNMALVCVEIPPRVHSAGIWRYGGAVLTSGGDGSSTFPVLERQMGLAFFTTQILHHILRCFGIPAFVSQMLAGLILGPGVLGNIPSYAKFMLSIVSQNVIGTLTLFGYSMFLFLIGVKMDISIVLRTGRKALYTGVFASLIPLILSLLSLKFLTQPKLFQLTRKDMSNLVFSAITNSQSSFPVIACLLGELRLLTSELGRLGLSSAIVCDILSLFLRSFTRLASRSMNKGQTAGLIPTLQTAFFMLVYIFAVVYVARPAMNWIIQQTPKGKPVHKGYLFFIMLVALITGLFSYWLDQFFYFGPFIFGLAVPMVPRSAPVSFRGTISWSPLFFSRSL